MVKRLEQIMAKFSAEEQEQIQAKADELIAEEMTLRQLRKAYQLTQVDLAKQLGVRQDTVSKLEQRTDLLLSTLTNYIQAMGGDLKLVAEFPDRQAVIVTGLADLKDKTNEPKNLLN